MAKNAGTRRTAAPPGKIRKERRTMKVIIVGGVAGGASCAARLRRLDEKAEIVMVERGPYLSYANCGLPYHLSGVIPKESSLLVANEAYFKANMGIDARTNCEAVSIDRKKKTVGLKDVKTGKVTTESYDKLVLSPGASSVRPPLPGIDLPGIFHVRTVPDARTIKEWIEKGTVFLAGMYNYSGIQFVKPPRHAVVVGGGFIGLETAENLVHAGFEVTLVEMLDQVLAPLDREFARLVEEHLKRHGVRLALGDGVAGFKGLDGGALEVKTKSGKVYPADVVILALGVKPDTTLAKAAGLEIGERGGIRVDDQMRTSDKDIFAVGDAIEVRDWVTGEWSLVALAGPANRQGRIAADVIAGRKSRFRGTQGTSIIGLFGGAAAWTGINEKTLEKLGDKDYEKVYLFPNSHAGYYPGAKPIGIKLLFRKSDGRLLGAQAIGEDGPAVDKRISALAVALQMKATIYDLEEAELCYAPQFGSAKDPVNFAGMVAADVVRGDMPLAHWDQTKGAFLLDVRTPVELVVESVPGAVNIPLHELRARLGELPKNKEILIICRSAQRAYYATRVLLQKGFKARNLSGGMLARVMYTGGPARGRKGEATSE
jgi:NADPH-dependent 2,4-dienoyl-CoA reductase/sulfur reductase-like enzyme/rhodanese-related sulfurtransferase